ncbi:sensor histidine kinase [Nannocystis bainbridge]|uniref:histidine kinase n=1 Tax=Nannocystis bainbridge TaxID=2995303 RepID=A0ABT5DWQ1_9BACT|nr:HAMP domain-containing sensor histidine kinase [Nannocystis bainbridge]MDC0717583.1 HAMP domain-containing sensor histidine kinase [Nannocystis bainbridge]
MKLRLRLALTTIAVTIPMIVVLVLFDAVARHRAAEEALAGFALARMQEPGGRERCEADPSRWGGEMGPGRGPPGAGEASETRGRAASDSRGRESGAAGASDLRGRESGASDLRGRESEASDSRGRESEASDSRGRESEASDSRGREAKMGPPLDDGRPRGRPAVLFAYDAALRSANPAAPAIAEPLAQAIATSEVATSEVAISEVATPEVATPEVATWPRSWARSWWSAEVEVLVRMPWEAGPCARVLAQGSTVPGWLGAVLPPTRIWLAPLVALFAAVLLAMGPIVGRIRRLTEAVRRSASAGYASAVPIDGSDEVGELARAFEAAGREVRAQLTAKDRREAALREFLANTTHDVMIPLTVLQGHLSELNENASAGAAIDRAAVVAAMGEAHYIAAIVHNLAVMAKIDADAPRLHREPVAMDVLVERVLARHRPIARRLQVELDGAVPESPLHVEGDVTLLEQAVSNVVYNAIRHNRAGGHVAVLLDRVGGDRFRLRVVDDGPGVAADELTRLVERGFRSDAARTRAPDGQGLGLHIAARVAALHGIGLVFESPPGGGLQVDFIGPRVCAEAADSPHAAHS